MKQTVRAQEVSGVDGSFTWCICRPAACFFDDDSQRGEIPVLRSPVQCCIDGAFCDQHVLPESADRASIARGVGQASNLFPRFFAFAWPGACREDHGVFQVRDLRYLNLLPVAIGAFAAIGPPARSQPWV